MTDPLRILFVEDSTDDAKLTMLQFEQEGVAAEFHRVQTEADFIAALASTPDLILSDYSLPQFNGLRALSIVKERGMDVPFILISGTVGEDIAVSALQQGADDYLMKDRPARLISAVRHALDQHRLRAERKRADQALRESEERLRAIIETSPDSITLSDLKGDILMTNRQTALLYGYDDPNDMIGMHILDLIAPEDRERMIEFSRLLPGAEASLAREFKLLRRDGSTMFGELRSSIVNDENGKPQAVIGVMRDITERKRAEEKLNSQNEYLALLNDMTRAILLSNDYDSTLRALTINLKKIINADDCYILRWDEERQAPIPASESTVGEEEANAAASILREGRAVVIEDALHSPRVFIEIARRHQAHSFIGIPLIAGNRNMGAALIFFHSHHVFTQEEIERAEHAGAQIAIALWNFQQGAERQQRLRESNALIEIGRALSETQRVGSNTVLQLIVNSARELIPRANQAVVHILDHERKILTPQAISGFSEETTKDDSQLRLQLGIGVAGQVIQEGVTMNIADVRTDARFLRAEDEPTFRSLLVAPVQSGSQQIGTISVQSNEAGAFSAKDEDLLKALGTEAAIAIENTRLFEAIQQRLKEVDALYKTSQGLAASLDPDELIKDVVALLHKNFGYYYVQVYLLDLDTDDLILKMGSGEVGERLLKDGFRLPGGAGIPGHVAETAVPFVTENVNNVVFFERNPLLPDTQSEMAAPIKLGNSVIGILDIQDKPPHRLTDEDLQLIIAVADQLAVALQKANLYSDLQASLRQEQAIRSQLIQSERLALVGRLLASVSHELNNPLQAIQNALFLLKEETGLSNQGRQDLDIVLSETERMAALIERLRSAYRPIREVDFQPVQLNNLIEDVYALIGTHLRHKEIAFEFFPDANLPAVAGIPDQLRQVALNLFLNAVEVMPPGGRLTVQTRELKTQSEILLQFMDSGPGIDPDILPNIFDPFVTSKTTGTGLGLTITRDIIEQHNGRIEAINNPAGGAIFNIWLPAEKGG